MQQNTTTRNNVKQYATEYNKVQHDKANLNQCLNQFETLENKEDRNDC